ncbi:hypothetical protein D3C86_1482320 [compost metagenome]
MAINAVERLSWIPPAKNTLICSGWSSLSRRSICFSQRTMLDKGPTWPPHSLPSNTNLLAPSFKNISNKDAEGTCRKVLMPNFSKGLAWDGLPPAMSTTGGICSLMYSICSSRNSCGAKPRIPTPQVLSPASLFVSAIRFFAVSPFNKERAIKGSAPASATALAKVATSLTLVIGPCAIG